MNYLPRLTLILFVCCCVISTTSAAEPKADKKPAKKLDYAIVVHGGAGSSPKSWSAEDRAGREKTMAAALKKGRDILAKGGTSLDAVEQVIRLLEDDPLFNAGRGAVMNADGGHELDSSIMDGSNRACGAVAGVKTIKNPISLARLVMTKTRHVLLAADGADRFGKEMGVKQVDQKYFSTDEQLRDLKKVQQQAKTRDKNGQLLPTKPATHFGTVGCAALDRHGNLAAGTSTGGLTNKKYGRVGDSPIVAAGTYADNATCAVSCTGVGEDFIRNAIAFDVSALMAYKGWSVQQAVRHLIRKKTHTIYGGIIALSHDGSIAVEFNTPGMSRAMADSSGRFEVKLGK
ncbi:MAG: isoaspartyl peptidase/L-asparaginase [Planctomycetes bacterium]|nr:isoaspartyl peptidase/L-asparaginase [Planctomycetota bacterium]